MTSVRRQPRRCARTPLLSVVLLLPGAPARAQPLEAGLDPVVVSSARSARPGFDVPASIDALDAAALGATRLQVNLSESLARVPGIVAQNRQNYAQDLQISSRGFGARSTFGVRGLRLYVDGIPATMPDGQGQVSHIDLSSSARIEVLRGPYSVLYGNSSGGVIRVFTQDGGPDAVAAISTAIGSDGTRRVGLKTSGQRGRIDYTFSGSRFETDGYRDHSAAERGSFNGKLGYAVDRDTRWTVVLNSMHMPAARDPLGLTRAEFQADPRQAPRAAREFDTRKSVGQDQIGATLDHRVSADASLRWTVYAGRRETTQFLAIPAVSQVAATSPGGVVDLARDFRGTDARWVRRTELLGTPAALTAGLAYDEMDERRRGYLNFIGPASAPTQTGAAGDLRRDESNRVRSFDQYLQGEWTPSERWTALAGIRHARVSFRSADRYLVNGDDSGTTAYQATTQAAGLVFHADAHLNVHAAVGRGFETPTLNELAYRPSGAAGLNSGLNPARSRQWELGLKARFAGAWLASAAYFEARTSDEIVVLTNTGGRTVFRNAGRTARTGFEFGVSGPLGAGFSLHGAVTALAASYRDEFSTCTAAPCAAPVQVVPAGNRLPGAPRRSLYAELQWQRPTRGFETAVELRHVSEVLVDDLNTMAADAYTVVNLRFSWRQDLGRWSLREFVRIDNLADRQHAGSVIVNEGNARYFEAVPGRNWLVGVSAAYRY